MIRLRHCRYGPMLYLHNDKWIGKSLDYYGEVFEDQISLMKKFINEDDVVIDAGANIGSMTIPFAQKAKSVISFEPQEFLYYVLCGNIAQNDLYNVRAYCKAVGATSGKKLYCPSPLLKSKDGVPFYDDQNQNFGGVYLTEEPRFDTDFEVETIAIDDLKLKQCNFIKLDIEGDELLALQGAKETIQKFRPVIFMESMPWTLPKLSAAIKEIGYVQRTFKAKFFNLNNHFKYSVDVLRDESDPDIPMMSSDIICYHKDMQKEMDCKYFDAIKETL